MFKKWYGNEKDGDTKNTGKETEKDVEEVADVKNEVKEVREVKEEIREKASVSTGHQKIKDEPINTILKGSKLTGDINVSCDLELSGDIEGNIKSVQGSNITIKGTCTGNIETKAGNVDIEGEMRGGNITAGGNVTISGKFNGGNVTAKGKVYVDGEFNGNLDAHEIEIGPGAHGKGALFYKEFISISKGAKVEAQISRSREEHRIVNKQQEKKVRDIKPPVQKASEVK